MTDQPESPKPSEGGTYRACTACHCQVHRDLEFCPECGAYPGELDSPHPERGIHLVLTLALLVILGGLLALFARDREAAREAELSRITLLSPSEKAPLPESGGGAPITPNPTPTATPLPAPPTPTPPPFNPADLGLAPEPTPAPTPTRRPPTPTPVPSMLDIKDELKAEMRNDLNEQIPLASPGEKVTLTFRNNRSVTGTLLRTDARQFQLQTATGPQWFPYRQLLQQSRLRVDTSEREAWLEERALEEVLKRL